MVKGLKAGLLALTILATTAPAIAQPGDGGGRDGRGGGEHQGNGGGNHGGGGNRGPGPANGGQPGGGGAQAPRPQPSAPNRNWNDNGGGNRWQGQRPQVQPPQPAIPSQPSGGWQNQNRDWNHDRANRDTPNRDGGNRDWNHNGANRDGNRGNVQWDNRGGNDRGGYGRPDAGRPDYGRPDYSRPGNSWQGGGRLNNADRWRDQRRWSNDWRRDNRYDWSRYRQSYRDYYHLPAYRAPSGWGYGYSRFSIGVYLGGPLFSSSYWIDDPYSYRLPPAYGTLRWVRYYNDALLVDIRDGYVVDVIHDFFW
ncbi:MAG TPA: RcnB family protein [Sphingobium sp.]|uniref:RcnB family protein n=1 Tax=Sphingobium sp. TaxID=1912891 RepID=UPI002ED4E4C5